MNAKKILGYLTGVSQIKNVAGDLKKNFCDAGVIIGDTIKLVKNSTDAQKTDWLDEPEQFFDQVCRENGTTTASVKKTYLGHFLAGWCFLIIWMWSCWVNFTHSSFQEVSTVINMAFLTSATACLIAMNEYRMFTAREQRIIRPVDFLKLLISTPNLWVPVCLPRGYMLRIER